MGAPALLLPPDWVLRQTGHTQRPRLREGSEETSSEQQQQQHGAVARDAPQQQHDAAVRESARDAVGGRMSRENSWSRSGSLPPPKPGNQGLGQEVFRSRSGMSRAASGMSASGDGQELGSRSHTGGSVERAQLSPSLMQRIQKVKQNAAAPSSSQARELSGWGSGIPNAAQMQMQYAMAPGSMMPFVPTNTPLPPGFMMMPSHAMAGPPMVAQYAFAPAVPGTPGAQAVPSMMYIPAAHPPFMQQPWMSYPFMHQPMPGMAAPSSPPISSRANSLPPSFLAQSSNHAGGGAPDAQALHAHRNAVQMQPVRRPAGMARALSHSIPKAAVLSNAGEPQPQMMGRMSPLGVPPAHSGAQHSPSHEGGFDSGDEDSKEVTTIYIGNLPPEVDEAVICVPFSAFGRIHSVQVIRDKNTMLSRGFAFITYFTSYSAAAAIQNMNGCALGAHFQGRQLKVGPSHRC
ncbi:hypothetical protein WJX73_008768 [Symbiochloris irregularis]|uniref:RRM domain-containing protein n=1 Tax=Symbiochloris irregularis TaxID=706552 RepID=A0AAW1NQ88_9CHLO